jgi:SAM-dependent methyltransferase
MPTPLLRPDRGAGQCAPRHAASARPRYGLDAMDLTWIDDEAFELDGSTFRLTEGARFRSNVDEWCLVKPRDLVEQYLALLAAEQPKRIVELGINKGGSTAMLALLAQPERLVALELDPDPIVALDHLVTRHQLANVVRHHYGIDQADGSRVAEVVDAWIEPGTIDLVVDDASHLLDPTRASFDVLFPRLRPGGAYVIEDWAWAHLGWNTQKPDEVPLTVLLFELLVTLPQVPGLIDRVEVDRHWALVRRGPAEVDPAAFALQHQYARRGRDMIAPLAQPDEGDVDLDAAIARRLGTSG